MTGSNEIARLAGLLRISADTARRLASVYSVDIERMGAVARQAEAMAAELDAISTSITSVPLLRRNRTV